MKEKEAKQIIESEFGDLKKEERSQYDTLVSLLVKYGADENRPLEKLVIKKNADGLLPCPFCGETKKVKLNEAILKMNPAWMVECMICYASVRAEVTKAKAIEVWNKRV